MNSTRAFVFVFMFLVAVVAPAHRCRSQTFHDEIGPLLAVNVGTNALVGALGSAIHKPKNMPLGRALLRGAGRGALGGLVILSGKALGAQVWKEQSLAYGWPSRLVVSLGASMVENTIRHKPLLGRYAIDVGPVFFTIERGHVRAQLLPIAALRLIQPNARLDWHATALMGQAVWVGGPVTGSSDFYKGGMLINPHKYPEGSLKWYHVLAHEQVHGHQHREALAWNMIARIEWRPLRWIKMDGTFFDFLYPLMPRQPYYYSNWYEREAELFSSGLHTNNSTL